MFSEDRSLIDEEVLDPQVMRIIRAVNYTAYRMTDGRTAFGYDMRDGTYLLVEPEDDLSASAKHPVWKASHVDATGRGFRSAEANDLHNALVQSFKMPSPVLDIEHDSEVVDCVVVDEVEAHQEIERRMESVAPAMAI